MADTNLSLKLLVDGKNNKVLFAEAGKEFVDFLFHIMSLPVATVVKLINVTDMVGCVGELYTSIESLDTDYMLSNVSKNSVLNPRIGAAVPLLSLSGTPSASHVKHTRTFYGCSSTYNANFAQRNQQHAYVTSETGVACPSCNVTMSKTMTYVEPEESEEEVTPPTDGYVKGVVTYMVMDNLEVKPMSTISGITLINKFGVADISSLVEKQVQVTLNEGVAILKASLETRAVLTTVFLGNRT